MRRAADRLLTVLAAAITALAAIPLVSIVAYTVIRGARALGPAFFTQLPAPVGTPGGGVGNAIVGSGILIGVACLCGVPAGVLAGVFVAEIAPRGRLAALVGFCSDVLAGVPTIVVGVFVYVLFVLPLRRFNALSGGIALAIVLLPTIVRTTAAVLRLVPDELREAALALGVPHWRATVGVVLRAAAPGIATGALLGLARIAGETAPLLFTAFGNTYWSTSLLRPIAALPLLIFEYSISPYADWQTKAWGAALLLVTLVLAVNLLTRKLVGRR